MTILCLILQSVLRLNLRLTEQMKMHIGGITMSALHNALFLCHRQDVECTPATGQKFVCLLRYYVYILAKLSEMQ